MITSSSFSSSSASSSSHGPKPYGYSSTTSSNWVNGVHETKSHVYDSEKGHIASLTRGYGDKTKQTVIKKGIKNNNNHVERVENYVGMEKEEMPTFDKKWMKKAIKQVKKIKGEKVIQQPGFNRQLEESENQRYIPSSFSSLNGYRAITSGAGDINENNNEKKNSSSSTHNKNHQSTSASTSSKTTNNS